MLASNLHLQVQIPCQDTCLVSLVLDIRLNTLIFIFLTTSGTHNLANGSLILSQLPLHLFTTTAKPPRFVREFSLHQSIYNYVDFNYFRKAKD